MTNALNAACPADVTQLNVSFTGTFNSSDCKYKDFKRFKCYPIIELDSPLSYDNKLYNKLPINYDNARKHIVVEPFVKRNKESKIKGCGVLGYFDPGISIYIWELNDD